MSKIYSDYLNETSLTIPDKFIDVKTGESYPVSPKVQEQIAYHAKNNTLIHLVFSALNHYLHPSPAQNAGTKEIMIELMELKKLIKQGYYVKHNSIIDMSSNGKATVSEKLNLKDVEDVIEAFGG